MIPCRASTMVRGRQYNFKYYDLDTSFRIELDEIDACPLRDVAEVSKEWQSYEESTSRPQYQMIKVVYNYMKRIIPQPSEQEEIVAEGTYNEYRSQAEEDMQPKHISHIIENAPEDSILGLISSIKSDADAITRTDGPTDKKYEWPDDPDHDCYHMEEVH